MTVKDPRHSAHADPTLIVPAVAAQILFVLARPAHAQDVTVLVYALAPPILLTPPCLALVRWLWLRALPQPSPRILPLLIASAAEVLLWVLLIGCALVLLTGEWNTRAIVGPLVAVYALWIMSRIWIDASHKSARWLFITSTPLVWILLAAANWLVLSVWEL